MNDKIIGRWLKVHEYMQAFIIIIWENLSHRMSLRTGGGKKNKKHMLDNRKFRSYQVGKEEISENVMQKPQELIPISFI